MTHEFRESPSDARYCGACGQPYALCRGTKPIDLAFLKERPEFAPDAQAWDRWCARYGVDPNTPDERFIDDYLHGREPRLRFHPKAFEMVMSPLPPHRVTSAWIEFVPDSQVNLRWRDDAQREWYAACEAFSAAYARFPLTTRRLQDRAEVCELERLWLL